MKKHLFIFTLLLIAYTGYAQIPGLPNPSATQTIMQEFGLGKVSITYSRPNVKNRHIFGGLVPYGEVWRTGANTATAITFSEDVIVEGHDVPAGTYSLFCIPQKNEWTIILNKTTGQWGAYTYKESNDFLRFKVKTGSITEKQESFTIQFANSTATSMALSLAWDHTYAAISMQTNDDAKIMANIDQLMSAKEINNLTYFNAIQYYYVNNKDTDKALSWIAGAEEVFPKRASYKLFKSRFLLRKGDKTGARSAAEAGIKTAQESHDEEYLKLNQEALELSKK
jgi:hypothetical protein